MVKKSKKPKGKKAKGKKNPNAVKKRLTWEQSNSGRKVPSWVHKKKRKPRKDPPKRGKWVCYTIKSAIKNATYVGKTNDLGRRIRQHNGELKGGARKTKGKGPWTPFLVVKGFQWEHHCLQFEWALQHPWDKKKQIRMPIRSMVARCKALEHTLSKKKFTSAAPKSSLFNLEVHSTMSKVKYLKKLGLSEHEHAIRQESRPYVKFRFGQSVEDMKTSVDY